MRVGIALGDSSLHETRVTRRCDTLINEPIPSKQDLGSKYKRVTCCGRESDCYTKFKKALSNSTVQYDNKYLSEFVDSKLRDKFNIHRCVRDGCSRVIINVSGMIFETTERTLWRIPDSLLGNPAKLIPFWDVDRHEYFFDRHRPSFQAILFFYQSGGKLVRPVEVPLDVFVNELKFFEFNPSVIKTFMTSEGYIFEKVPTRPKNPIQRIIWITMEEPTTSMIAKVWSIFSISMILLSVASFCAETIPELDIKYGCLNVTNLKNKNNVPSDAWNNPFYIIETVCVTFFTFEYLVRYIACPLKLAFIFNFFNTVDLLAIFPYFLVLIISEIEKNVPNIRCHVEATTSGLTVLRAIRFLRIFKLAKHFKGLQVLGRTIKASLHEFMLFFLFFAITCIIFSSVIYGIEVSAKGDESPFKKLSDAFYFTVITMTTVGYGDFVPETLTGKLVGTVCVLSGVLVLAIPVPVIVTNFTNYYNLATGRYDVRI